MEESQRKIGGTLKVPNVQELAKKQLDRVPTRYQRSHEEGIDPSIIFSDHKSSASPELPVIDLCKLLSDDDSSELQRLHQSCQEWGFFQLINHGVSSSLVEKVKVEIQKFFQLPIEKKMKFEQKTEDLQGYGQAFVMSEEQKLDWCDLFYIITHPIQLRNPHLLSQLPSQLRDALDEYSMALLKLAMEILNLMAKALEMKADEMRLLFEDGMQSMRLNYYPPCPFPEQVIGITPHSDATVLTILIQVNEMDGLQIRKDDVWIPVIPVPNSFIVNIGDILEIVTNGKYRSLEHRAMVNSKKERLSIATFLNPGPDGVFGPAPSLISPEKPPLFKEMRVADYFKGFYSRELKGRSYIDVMRIQPKEEH